MPPPEFGSTQTYETYSELVGLDHPDMILYKPYQTSYMVHSFHPMIVQPVGQTSCHQKSLPSCSKGKPCGRACIAKWRNCHKL